MSEEEIRTIKTATCSSLSGRSSITYEIGVKADNSIFIRLTENTGSGMFSKQWVPLTQIIQLLSVDDKPITSRTIRSLYSGSVNSVGFLQAVLTDVGLIKNMDENSRSYVRCDPKKFTAEINSLIDTPLQKKSKKSVPDDGA
jgi:hypothetical protein